MRAGDGDRLISIGARSELGNLQRGEPHQMTSHLQIESRALQNTHLYVDLTVSPAVLGFTVRFENSINAKLGKLHPSRHVRHARLLL